VRPLPSTSRAFLPLLVILSAAMIFVASVAVTGRQIASQAKLEAAAHRIGIWEVGQALHEASRLRTEFHRLPAAGEEPGAALNQRFDILWSRILALEAAPRDGPAYETLLGLRARTPHFFDVLRALENELPGITARDGAAVERAEHLLAALLDEVRTANGALHRERESATEAVAAGIGRLHASFALSAVGLIASATLLSALLFWLWRNAQGSLVEAEAARAQAGRSERLLRVLVDALPVMVSAHDRQGRFLFANDALHRFLGLSEGTLRGRRLADVTGRPADARDLAAALAGGARLPFREVRAAGAAGPERTLLTTVVPVDTDDGLPERAVRIAIDITDRKEAEERIRHAAEHDTLTGLANRAHFARRLAESLEEGRMVALHVIDLDDFKAVNDSLGHGAGDALLIAVAGRLKGCLRPGEVLARLGGDEFAMVQTRIAEAAEADEAAGRIGATLARPHLVAGAAVTVRGSIGAAIGPMDGLDATALLQRANMALHRAKASGTGLARRYCAAMEADLVEQRRLEADVRLAVEDGGFHFAYQPKFRIGDLGLSGCEALVRWNHPQRGAVPPSAFLPAIESAGLAVPFAMLTLRSVLRQQRAWRAEGLVIPVAANLSARHVVSGQAPGLLREALAAEGDAFADLEIEVTEDILIHDPAAAAATLAGLRACGVRVALDDFGTGYSSLGYLQQLAFDTIKLDRSFIAGLDRASPSEQIVDAVVRIAHGLGATLVAEGVETTEQLDRLRLVGCDEVQGYLLGRPMPPEALAALARDGARPEPARAQMS